MTDNPDQRRDDSEEEKPDPLSMVDDELAAELFGEDLRDRLKELARKFRDDDGE